jgi:hypothetical protein
MNGNRCKHSGRRLVQPACRDCLGGKPSLNHAVAHVFERKSVVPEHELLSVALSHRLGAVDLNHLKAAVKHSPDLVKTERGFSTQGRFWRRNWI